MAKKEDKMKEERREEKTEKKKHYEPKKESYEKIVRILQTDIDGDKQIYTG